jgi:hypothetical protein
MEACAIKGAAMSLMDRVLEGPRELPKDFPILLLRGQRK